MDDNNSKTSEEWIKQADYDMDTAELMFTGKRYFYAVFMSHLAIEKALKGLYAKKLKKAPPKTHNLLYFVESIKLVGLSEEMYDFVFTLNRVSVPTRYPDDLDKLLKEYNQEKAKETIEKSKELLKWLKEKS